MAIAETERGLVVTMPGIPERGWPLVGVGVFMVLASLVLGGVVHEPERPITPLSYAVIAGYTLVVGALAWYLLDQGLAHLREIAVVVDPKTQTLLVPSYGELSARPTGHVAIPLSDVVDVRPFETGLKGVMRGKVCVHREVASNAYFPSYSVAPFATLETFATEIARAVDIARTAASKVESE